MLLTRGTAILPWPRGGRALLAGVRPGLYTERCFSAGCGCDRGAVGTWAWFAVHCTPGKHRRQVNTKLEHGHKRKEQAVLCDSQSSLA